jgi:hypothetical protein
VLPADKVGNGRSYPPKVTISIHCSVAEKISRNRDETLGTSAERIWRHGKDGRKEYKHGEVTQEDRDPCPDRHFFHLLGS